MIGAVFVKRVRMVGYACNNRSYVFVEHERNQEKNSYQLYETLHINDVEFLCSPREENQNSEV